MKDLLLIGLGSCLGGMARHLVGLGVRHLGVASLWGTLAVNLLGCLLIGLLAGLFARHPNVSLAVQRFLTIGVCGGFTTFSTFSRDGLTLWQDGLCALCRRQRGSGPRGRRRGLSVGGRPRVAHKAFFWISFYLLHS